MPVKPYLYPNSRVVFIAYLRLLDGALRLLDFAQPPERSGGHQPKVAQQPPILRCPRLLARNRCSGFGWRERRRRRGRFRSSEVDLRSGVDAQVLTQVDRGCLERRMIVEQAVEVCGDTVDQTQALNVCQQRSRTWGRVRPFEAHAVVPPHVLDVVADLLRDRGDAGAALVHTADEHLPHFLAFIAGRVDRQAGLLRCVTFVGVAGCRTIDAQLFLRERRSVRHW